MYLRDFMHKYRVQSTWIAQRINYHPSFINQVANGNMRAGAKFAKMIESLTKGLVTKEEVIEWHEKNKIDKQQCEEFLKTL